MRSSLRRRKWKRARKKRSTTQEEKQENHSKWLTHYCSDHQILLVGDGDFSFSLCLAKAFGSASNIVASSLDTYGDVIRKYKNAKSNLDELLKLGACVLHRVDATKMKFHSDLNRLRFDRIIYNFPHAGFHGKKEVSLKMIKMHSELVLGFLENASWLLLSNGEIDVNHKTTPPFSNWNIEELGMQSSLKLIECVDFKIEDYQGYNNKRGDGSRCDEPFPLGKCSTFKFIVNTSARKDHLRRNQDTMVSRRQRQRTSLPFQEIQSLEQLPAPVDLNYYPQTGLFLNMNEAARPVFDLKNRYPPTSRDYFNSATDIHGRVASTAYVGNGYTPISRDFNNVVEMNERVASSAYLGNGYSPTSRDYFNNGIEIPGRVASTAYLGNGYTPISRDFNNVAEMHGRVASSAYLGNGYTPISGDYFNNVREMHGIVASSADCYYRDYDRTLDSRRLLHPIEPLQMWPTSSNCTYSLTDSSRRTMDIAPSLSIGTRRAMDKYLVFGDSSGYLQEDLYRTTERPSYCFEFDRGRPDFENYNADVPRRTLKSGIHVGQRGC